MIDGVRVQHDAARLALAEDFREAHARDDARAQDILEDRARADGRQLVDVADEDDVRALRHGGEEIIHEHDVHHRDFVKDDDVGLQGIVRVLREHRALAALRFEHAVDRHSLAACRFREALRRASRRRAEQDGKAELFEDFDHAAHDRRLARAGAARQHEDA